MGSLIVKLFVLALEGSCMGLMHGPTGGSKAAASSAWTACRRSPGDRYEFAPSHPLRSLGEHDEGIDLAGEEHGLGRGGA